MLHNVSLNIDFKGRYFRFEIETEFHHGSQGELKSHELEFQIGLKPAEEIPEEKTIGLMRKSSSIIFKRLYGDLNTHPKQMF